MTFAKGDKVVYFKDLRACGLAPASNVGDYDEVYLGSGIPFRALITVLAVSPFGFVRISVDAGCNPWLRPEGVGWPALRSWWPEHLFRPWVYPHKPGVCRCFDCRA